MGLDQYAHVRINKWNPHEYSFEWRKHSRLQQFMMELWHSKGFNEEFNLQELHLDIDDITKLEEQVHKGYEDYPCPGGFFWGHQWQEEAVEDEKGNDLDFIERAKQALQVEGSTVVYSCWY
jgi:hypothetical protein